MVPATKTSSRRPTSPVTSNVSSTHSGSEAYSAKHKIRFVTAASLFDGHDAAINIMRRLIQAHGAEVIHLGHNRSVDEVVDCAIQEDVHGIAITSYQGGHVEYFKYMIDMLEERGARTSACSAAAAARSCPRRSGSCSDYGVERIYRPTTAAHGPAGHDRRRPAPLRLRDRPPTSTAADVDARRRDRDRAPPSAARARRAENYRTRRRSAQASRAELAAGKAPVLGITGTGGAGKSSLVDELLRRFLRTSPTSASPCISVDPSQRNRRRAARRPHPHERARTIRASTCARWRRAGAPRALAARARCHRRSCKAAGFDLVIVETAGIGQTDSEIVDLVDFSLYVMTTEYGAATQLEKIDMLDFADLVVHQQVRQARRPRRAARRAQAVAAQPRRVRDAPTRTCRSSARSRPSSTTPA